MMAGGSLPAEQAGLANFVVHVPGISRSVQLDSEEFKKYKKTLPGQRFFVKI